MQQLDWSIIQSVLTLIIAVAAFYFARKKDTSDVTAMQTSLIVKLDNIHTDLSEMKAEINTLKDDWRADHDRLIELTKDLKHARDHMQTMWTRIDEVKAGKTTRVANKDD